MGLAKGDNHRNLLSRKFHRHELRRAPPHIGQRVSVASGQPLHVARLESSRHGDHAVHVAADFEIANRDQQMRAIMMMTGYCGSGLQVDRGDAGPIADKQDFDVPTGEFFVSAFHGPGRGSGADLVVLDKCAKLPGVKRVSPLARLRSTGGLSTTSLATWESPRVTNT